MVASAGIIIIGDEILSGRTKDSNINWIACELDNLGIRLKEARIIPDDSSIIIRTIQGFSKKYTYVFARFSIFSDVFRALFGILCISNVKHHICGPETSPITSLNLPKTPLQHPKTALKHP